MPRRQVRFNGLATVNFYTPESSNAGLSNSDSPSSLSSSPGPATPPSLYPAHLPPPHIAHPAYGYKPFRTRSLPPPALVAPQVHHYLSPSAGIIFNQSLPPTFATTRDRRPLSSRALAEPATQPPRRYLQICSPYFPWRIQVHATGGYVTVDDVLNALYTSLRKNINQDDYRMLSQSSQLRVKGAYERRWKSIRDPHAADRERRGGVKRVDFLMERKWFRGLSLTSALDVWQLEVT